MQARDISGGVHFHTTVDRVPAVGPRQLPGDVPGFVNRFSALARLDRVLAGVATASIAPSTCVIVGAAGVGKTSLAVHWAHGVCDLFPDGQLYVNLRGYDPGEPVGPAEALDWFLRALSVPPSAIPAEMDARSALYRSVLANRRILVVLDNAATVKQVRPLLPGSANCMVLVTSRSRLSGLIARDGAYRVTLDVLPGPEAVKVLRYGLADYRTADDENDIAELAGLCGGLPLALRIAAERAASRPHIPLRALIADLRDQSALWDVLSSEDDEEGDAVRTVFAWSYRALPPDAARMFHLLGLHPGPEFALPAAAALAGAPLKLTRQLLDVLVGAHLVEQTASDRYQFHDLLRAYAADQAMHEESPEQRAAALERLLAWYLHTAHAAGAALDTYYRSVPLNTPAVVSPALSFDQLSDAVCWFEAEWANLRAATLAADRAGLDRYTWQLPLAFRHHYAFRSSVDGRLELLNLALTAVRRTGDRFGEVECLFTLAVTHRLLQQYEEALEADRQIVALARTLKDPHGEAMAANHAGVTFRKMHRFEDARAHFEQAANSFQILGQSRWEAMALTNLAQTCLDLRRPHDAASPLARARQLRLADGNTLVIAETAAFRARVRLAEGDIEGALADARSSVEVTREIGSRRSESDCLLGLGKIQQAAGLPSDALISFHRSATLYREDGLPGYEAQALDCAGAVYASLDRHDEAARFHQRAVAVFRNLGQRWHLAIALDHLATVLHRTNARDDARRHWCEALTLLAEFDDAQAVEKRNSITQHVGAV
ncbi:ATP-binding protein [Streptomyces sioyaensis]|uniref:ATP-binding protein n=1 Tax=Streptomyces sioyaensis TaxID=67364 RepID=UPI0037A24C88